MDFQALLQHIGDFLLSAQGAAASVALVVEFVLRLVPSEKPLSLLYGVALVFHAVGRIFNEGGNLLDKILPQKLS